jgi:L-aspartate oxidase
MEFFQFHPTALCKPGAPRFLISEAVRGEGGILRNSKGEVFAHNYHPDGELAPRDVVSRAILAEMSKTRSDHAYLDITHMPSKMIVTRFPSIYRFCLTQGVDITKEMIPIAPAAHYMIGGVKANVWGETSIRGLYACGEAACTGVHGANRLASNSLMETLVFGKRIAKRILAEDQWIGSTPEPNDILTSLENYAERYRDENKHGSASVSYDEKLSLTNLQELMWDNVGIIRSGENLTGAVKQLSRWFIEGSESEESDPKTVELKLMVICALLVSTTALVRTESRGTHYRVDYPFESDAWRKHILFQRIKNWDQ